ncbi:MAG TPA: FAD-dependent oxidoreductase [Myxococcota bacterium]|nr:FAD-dependent oxidoreductase [Myxococcota bacterium]
MPPRSTSPGERIAVVGAGMSGMSAARDLARAGREVVVFDKARGVGGRMPTRRHESGAFDHGAQYFTARSEAFRQQVADWCERGVAAPWQARVVRAAPGGVLSESDGEVRHVGVPKMSGLARDLVAGLEAQLEIRCGERVAAIEREGAGWRLDVAGSESAGSGIFEAVALAIPAPQALALLPEGFGVPSLRDRLARVEIDPCQAVLVHFEAPVDVPLDAAFVAESPLAWIARNTSKPGRPEAECWVLHGTPEWSRQHVETDPEEVQARLLEAFASVLDRPLPEPLSASSHRWLHAKTKTPAGRDCEWLPTERIGLCGDWMRGSRVEDAFLSGRSLAARMIGEH